MGEGWPEEWKTGLIVPLVKKVERKKLEDYREITLMPVSYKAYAEVLRSRLEKEVERNGEIPHNQAAFRTGMGTMDHVYTLNYVVNRHLREKVGKLMAHALGRGLMQGCPLSPILFSLLMADLEEKLKRRGKGGIKLEKGKIYSLAYADNIVLMADKEAGMRLLMKKFEKYVRKKIYG
ncbi:uncharacterized protein LOC122507345 [Leptopilina heterotoma]|uniref:uncharacterized protein LOC122507345 n=1 Tax=Leptopilina heterotoma TaxID=63436 RepID=UPI001CA9C127|nr:uncharacterized protein LOC122507345 [Leptopilina heterotoma]